MKSELKIEDMFIRNIRRDINGVIKVDDQNEDHVYTELDEYVITQETRQYFDEFFDRYVDSADKSTDKIGVWISGFFGSGKSHFIKMISYLLENKKIKDKKPIDFFKDKIQDPQILSNIEKVINKGTKDVILFNIDSKANTLGNNTEQIVNVFMKVFNEKRGYYADVFWIADLEEDLDYKGLYDKFKTEFEKISGSKWEDKRNSYSFEQDAIKEALSNIKYQSKESLTKLFDSDGVNYNLDVHKFAKKVKTYCDRKGKNHQVIFLVDEIGQYIGERTDLMLNLQTVVEELGVVLQGKSWVIVTSQADMNTITKDKIKSSDFSKIQGRFGKPLNLSSSNVDEVIKKRLLEKKKETAQKLSQYYDEKKIVIKNLISFSQGTAEMKSYISNDDFLEVYPFVPYQFNLLQKSLDKIRVTSFAGKSLAKGERSMLNAFQESTESICEKNIGVLVPFSSFFDSIESFLDPSIKRTFEHAKRNSRLNEKDIKVLKTLFMIKNLDEIKSNIDNLVTLSIENIDQDKLELRKSILESMEKLKIETLIHNSDDRYYFLTNEEQEVKREIDSQEIDRHTIRDDIFDIVFDEIFSTSKYGIYSLDKILDDRTKLGQNADLKIKFVTSLNTEQIWGTQHQIDGSHQANIDSTDTLLIIFPKTSKFVDQIREYKKISTFLAHKYSNGQPEVIRKILDEKSIEKEKLRELAKLNIKTNLTKSIVYIDNKKVTIDDSDANEFIKKGLKILVDAVFRKSNYITQNYNTEDDIKRILTNQDLEKVILGKTNNSQALNEILNYIKLNHDQNNKVLLGEVITKFKKKPFGWQEMTISGLIAILFVKEEISLKYQQELITNDANEVTKYLTKRDYLDKIKISLREKSSEKEIAEVKKIVRDLFEKTDIPSTETDLYVYCKNEINTLQQEYSTFLKQYTVDKYPGKEKIDSFLNYLSGYSFKSDPTTFFKHLLHTKEEFKQSLTDVTPVKNFFKSNQLKIFADSKKKIQEFNRNNNYLSDESKEKYEELLNIIEMDNPYQKIKEMSTLTKYIEDDLDKIAEEKRKEILSYLEEAQKKIDNELNLHKKLDSNLKKEIHKKFSEIKEVIQNNNDCTLLVSQKSIIDETLQNAFEKINVELKKIAKELGEKVRITKNIKANEFIEYHKTIETEEDIEKFLKELKHKLQEVIKKENLRFI